MDTGWRRSACMARSSIGSSGIFLPPSAYQLLQILKMFAAIFPFACVVVSTRHSVIRSNGKRVTFFWSETSSDSEDVCWLRLRSVMPHARQSIIHVEVPRRDGVFYKVWAHLTTATRPDAVSRQTAKQNRATVLRQSRPSTVLPQ